MAPKIYAWSTLGSSSTTFSSSFSSSSSPETENSTSISFPTCTKRKCYSFLIWAMSLAWTCTSLGLILYVNQSCEFVRIVGHSVTNNETQVLYRGLQRGQFAPSDTCTDWSVFEQGGADDDDNDGALILDNRMLFARSSAARSIWFGGYVVIWLVLWKMWLCGCCGQHHTVVSFRVNKRTGRTITTTKTTTIHNWIAFIGKWTCLIASLTVAVFQASASQFMIRSELCQYVYFSTTTNSSTTPIMGSDDGAIATPAAAPTPNAAPTSIVWEECDHNTNTYNLTYGAIVTWVFVAILVAVQFSIMDTAGQGKSVQVKPTPSSTIGDDEDITTIEASDHLNEKNSKCFDENAAPV